MPSPRILLVGCGKMGGALLRGWVGQGVAASGIVVVEPNPVSDLPAGIMQAKDAAAIPAGFQPDLILLAVKPQVMDAVAPAYARFAGPDTCFLSVAAGKTIATLQRLLGEAALIVRSIPNTPAAIAQGITACCAGPGIGAPQRSLCDQLLSAVGEVVWVDREELIDTATAVSGSGPAYVFLLTECLAAAGAKAGLPLDLATQLARATVAGAGALMRQSGEDAGQLRRNVTSPNGTTQAALDVLMAENGLAPLLERAVAAADKRSRELAG